MSSREEPLGDVSVLRQWGEWCGKLSQKDWARCWLQDPTGVLKRRSGPNAAATPAARTASNRVRVA